MSKLSREYYAGSDLHESVSHLLKCSECRDCGVYFKRMRAAGEFDEAKEDFEEFISAQELEW
jgi:hypothetical protein